MPPGPVAMPPSVAPDGVYAARRPAVSRRGVGGTARPVVGPGSTGIGSVHPFARPDLQVQAVLGRCRRARPPGIERTGRLIGEVEVDHQRPSLGVAAQIGSLRAVQYIPPGPVRLPTAGRIGERQEQSARVLAEPEDEEAPRAIRGGTSTRPIRSNRGAAPAIEGSVRPPSTGAGPLAGPWRPRDEPPRTARRCGAASRPAPAARSRPTSQTPLD